MTSASAAPIITIIGSLNTDLTTFTSRIPRPGETLAARSFSTNAGGKGANQAVACAKLSRSRHAALGERAAADVRMVGAVGDDAFGAAMLAELRDYGVRTEGVRVRRGERTGVAVIVVEEGTGENRILLSAEANGTLRPADFAALPAPRPALLLLQLEIPRDTVLQILRAARREGVPVLLNPAPAVPLPEEAYEGVTHLVVNETEAAILSGCREEDLIEEKSLLAVAKKFQKLGTKNVLITLGGRGVFYLGSEGNSGLVPAEMVKVVDTTAAGDTFVGAYSLEMVKEGCRIADAVGKANRAAAFTVQQMGAQVSIPWADELS